MRTEVEESTRKTLGAYCKVTYRILGGDTTHDPHATLGYFERIMDSASESGLLHLVDAHLPALEQLRAYVNNLVLISKRSPLLCPVMVYATEGRMCR